MYVLNMGHRKKADQQVNIPPWKGKGLKNVLHRLSSASLGNLVLNHSHIQLKNRKYAPLEEQGMEKVKRVSLQTPLFFTAFL